MNTSQRPLTARQVAELKSYVSPASAVGRVVLFLLVGVIAAALLRRMVGYLYPVASAAWWSLPPVALLVVLFIYARRWTGGPELRQRIRADLAGGVLNVHRIEVVDAIEVAEEEDEGPAYFLQTSDGRVLAFAGQYLDALKRRGFPWRVFEITEAPASKLCFKLKRLEGNVRPAFLRQPFSFAEFRQYSANGRYQVVDADFDSLKIKPVQK